MGVRAGRLVARWKVAQAFIIFTFCLPVRRKSSWSSQTRVRKQNLALKFKDKLFLSGRKKFLNVVRAGADSLRRST